MSRRPTNDYLVLLALWLMMFSASSQVIIVSPILPEIGEALNIAEALRGWLVTAYVITLGIFAFVIGPISDKIGRRRILLIGTTLMSVSLALHGIVSTFAEMLAVRALAGTAGGILSGAVVAYVGDYFPYERRGWANGWVISGVAVGQIIGIPIGKILAFQLGFRWPFLMFAITMAAASVLVWLFLPQPDVERDTQRLSVRRALTDYWALLKDSNVAAATGVYFLMFFSIGIYVIYLPTWLEDVVGVSETGVAMLFLVGGLANVVTSPAAGTLSDRVGRKPLIIISCLGFGVVMAATTYLIFNLWLAYAVFALAMVFVALRLSPLQSLMTALVPAQRRGMLMSLAISIGQIGMGFGSGTAGFAYTRQGYLSNTLIGAVSIFAMAWMVYKLLPEPEGEADATPTVDVEVQA